MDYKKQIQLVKKIFFSFGENTYLYGTLIFGFLFRIFYIFNFTKPGSYLWSDPGYYDSQALQMAHGQHAMFSTYWPPFFHIFLSLIYRPLIWLGLESQRIKIDVIIFALFYAVGFWCIYQITKKLFSKKIGFIVLGILTLWYPLIFLNYLIMSENLFFPLVFLGLYFLIVKPIKPSTGLWLGFFWGVALLARPIFALFLPLFVIWSLYYKIGWKLLLNFIITAGLIVVAMMAFNFYYTNGEVAGGTEKSISSNGGVGFAMLWCDAKSIEFRNNGYSFGFGPPANINYSDSKRIFTSVPFSNQKYYYQMGLSCLKNRPLLLIENFSSIIKIFDSHLFPTVGGVAGWETFRLLFKIFTGLLFVGSLTTIIGVLSRWIPIDRSVKKYLYLFSFIILSLLATVYLQNVGEERYLIPYAPILIILCLPIATFILNRDYVNKNILFLLITIVISLLIRTSLFNFQSGDYNGFLTYWYDFIKSNGILSFKNGFSDYAPLYLYFIGFFTLFSVSKLFAIKIISIIFDYVLAIFVFLIIKKKYPYKSSVPILAFAAILLAPTVILNSSYWGQSDAIFTSLLVASTYFILKNKPIASLILYGISLSFKVQAIFLFPLFIILFLKKKIKLFHFLAIPLIYIITIIPAGLIGRPWKDLFLVYWQQSKNYNNLTLNAPSMYQWLPSGQFNLFCPAGLFFAAAVVLVFIYAINKNKNEITETEVIKISFLSVALLPFLLPKMHDRYFFPADIFSIIFAFYFPKYFYIPVAMQIISFLSYGPFLWGKIPNFPLLSLFVLIILLITAFDLFKNRYQNNDNQKRSLVGTLISRFLVFSKVKKTEKPL